MKTLTMNQAAKECGRAKSTLSKAIKSGKMTAEKQEDGSYLIDPAEVFRVFPPKKKQNQTEPVGNSSTNTDLAIEIGRLQVELEAERRITANMEQTVADLRERLDGETEERRKLTAMITDQRNQNAATEAEKSPRGGLFGFFGGKGRAEG